MKHVGNPVRFLQLDQYLCTCTIFYNRAELKAHTFTRLHLIQKVCPLFEACLCSQLLIKLSRIRRTLSIHGLGRKVRIFNSTHLSQVRGRRIKLTNKASIYRSIILSDFRKYSNPLFLLSIVFLKEA